MSANDLEKRVGKLERTLSAFSDELRLALRYVRRDASSSLTKSRIVLEKLLIGVYNAEMERPPRKPLLGEMLADNQFTRKIERRIVARMGAIRDMANLGPHGEAVEPSDAARVLDDLCEVLDWYLLRYRAKETEPKTGIIIVEPVPVVPPPTLVGERTVETGPSANRLVAFRRATNLCRAGAVGLALFHGSFAAWVAYDRRNILPWVTEDLQPKVACLGIVWFVLACFLFAKPRWGVYVSMAFGSIQSIYLLVLFGNPEILAYNVAGVRLFCAWDLALVAMGSLVPGLYSLAKSRSRAIAAALDDDAGIAHPKPPTRPAPQANRAIAFRRGTIVNAAGAVIVAIFHWALGVFAYYDRVKEAGILPAGVGCVWFIIAFFLIATPRWAVYVSLAFGGLLMLFMVVVFGWGLTSSPPDNFRIMAWSGPGLVLLVIAILGPGLYAWSKR